MYFFNGGGIMFTDLLNIKSPYNFLSSTIKSDKYFDFIKEQKLNAAFQIDTNNMHNAVNFYFDALKKEIKPIIGVELEFDFYNLILIPNNNFGYRELMNIFSIYKLKNNFNAALKKISDCNSENMTIIVRPVLTGFEKHIKHFKDFFVGVDLKNKNFIPEEFGDKLILGMGINVLDQDEIEYMKVMTAIKNSHDLYSNFDYEANCFLDESKLEKILNVEVHKKNMNNIISLVQNNVVQTTSPKMIEFDNEKNIPSKNYLWKLCSDALENKITTGEIKNDQIDFYQDRLQHEFDTISQMGFENYFLVVSDFVNHAKEEKILVGPGRGSAAGSLISYLLNITEIDPIKYNLLFERFLNPKRTSMPDIDIDFQDSRRHEILEFLSIKYREHFALISTFQTMGVKNAIRDCARIINVPDEEVDDALKFLDSSVDNLDEEVLKKNSKLKMLGEKYNILFKYAKFLIGMPRQSGTHAAGIVIASEPLEYLVPISKGLADLNQIEYSAKYLEKLGLIKIDILGLRNLTTISEIVEEIKRSRNIDVDLKKIPLNDHETFHDLSIGETNSIFQFESRGMIETLRQVKPNSIVDLASVMALFRPGPIEFIPDFVKRKNEKKVSSGFGFEIDEILKETYGVIVYQEQVMKILQVYAGFELDRADIIRAAISKKNNVLLKSFRQEFLDGAARMQNKNEVAVAIWDHIEKFASYGFNKSHAIAYSIISYQMAYLKNHFRSEFNSSILNSSIKDRKKTKSILLDIKKHNGKISNPNIRTIISKYRVANGVLLMPLTVINGVSSIFVDRLKQQLKNKIEILNDKKNFGGVLLSIYNELMTKEIFDQLVKAGVFDWYQISRKNLLMYDEEILRWAKLVSETGKYNDLELDIFDESIRENEMELDLYETEALGFSVSANLISKLREMNSDVHTIAIGQLTSESSSLNVIGRITNISVIVDKNKENMAFIDFTDDVNELSVTVFASSYKDLQKKLAIGKIYIFNIRVQKIGGQIKGILNKIIRSDLTI
jgi:DNA polymerase-3 subunit alpha